jgi:hypothetical protein
MSKLTLRKFSAMYDGLELLTYSNNSIKLGDLYHKKGIKKILDFFGFNIAWQMGLGIDEAKQLTSKLNSIPPNEGSFANVNISDSMDKEGAISIPSIYLNLSNKLSQDKILGFDIGKITTKILKDELRFEVQSKLKKFSIDNKQIFRKELANLHIVEALFYTDDVKITISSDVNVDVNADIVDGLVNVSQNIDHNHNHVFSFSGAEYPFAIDLKKMKNFI